VVLTFVDITDRKKAEADLYVAQAALRERAADLERTVELRTAHLRDAVGELEHFSYALTHDMRAPLRAMRSFAELLEEEEADPSTRQDYIHRIKIAAERLDQLIADSLHYSKTPRARLPLEPIPLNDLLNDLIASYPNFHPDAVDITVLPLPAVMGNRAGLTQCFANLLGNAVKFIKPGSRPKIEIAASEAGAPNADNFVRIWVRDSGVGIAAEALPRIFGLFERATHSHEGTGLGLAIVRKVVGQMEGRVGVVSEEGVGSQFWVELRKAVL
jgi:signal transduction histidine kinase